MGKNSIKARNGLVAALDVGTTKVACFVARMDDGRPHVVGIGHQPTRGMRAGGVVDMEQVVGSVLATVSAVTFEPLAPPVATVFFAVPLVTLFATSLQTPIEGKTGKYQPGLDFGNYATAFADYWPQFLRSDSMSRCTVQFRMLV